MKKKFKKWW